MPGLSEIPTWRGPVTMSQMYCFETRQQLSQPPCLIFADD